MARNESYEKRGRDSRRSDNNVIAELLALKPLAFGSGVDKIDLVNWLNDNADNVRSGQKRIVIDNPENSKEVIKISYSMDGLYDNMNEVICYNTLLDMEYNGEITKDDLKLFSNATLLNDDPMLIVETAFETYRECEEFDKWLEDNRDDYRDMKKADLWAIFISTDEVLRDDYNRIQQILRKFIPSDATLTLEPDNYGIWHEGNRIRLVLYDMGSIVPIVGKNRPKCPNCGSDLTYVGIKIERKLSLEAAERLEGIYGCENEGCSFYSQKVYKLNRGIGKIRDSRVYAEYVDYNQRDLDDLYALDCNWFVPEYRIYSYDKYIKEYEHVHRNKKKTAQYDIMYQNYLCYEIGGVFQGLGGTIDDLKEDVTRKELTYNKFCKEYDILIDEELDVDRTKITDLAGAIAFINAVSDEGVTIQEVLGSRDKRDFEDIIDSKSKVKLSYDELDMLWDTLNPMLIN